MCIWNEITVVSDGDTGSACANSLQTSTRMSLMSSNHKVSADGFIVWERVLISVQLVRRLFDDVGGEGVVAGDADGVAGEGVGVPPGCVAAGHAEEAQRGEEDLAVGGRHQVVEDRIDGRTDVE